MVHMISASVAMEDILTIIAKDLGGRDGAGEEPFPCRMLG